MESLRFSIIIPAYNAEKYLRECLDSLSQQSYEGFEVIIVDDGSADQTYDICSKYADKDARFRVIKKKNGGVSSARNCGIENAHGEWIQFIDSDDVLMPSALEYLSKSIDDNPSSVMHIWGWQEFSGEGLKLEKVFSDLRNKVSTVDIRKRLFKGDPYMGYVWNKAFKRDLIGHIRFAEDIKYNEDRLFVFNYLSGLLKTDVCSVLSWILYKYRQHNRSAMSNIKKWNPQFITDIDAFYRMALSAFEEGDDQLTRQIVHNAWYNIRSINRQIKKAADKDIDFSDQHRFCELSLSLYAYVPRWLFAIWYAQAILNRIKRLLSKALVRV